jgi:hypothetical protein
MRGFPRQEVNQMKSEKNDGSKKPELVELSTVELELVAGGRNGVNSPRSRGGSAN